MMFAQGWAVRGEELGSMQGNGLTDMLPVQQKNVIRRLMGLGQL